MADSFVLEIPEQVGLAVATARRPQAKRGDWPAGTRIVSADSHMLENDLWVDRFPPELRDQAPRMIFHDGGWDLSVGGKPMTPGPVATALCNALECYPGLTDLDARIADLDIEGVEKELIFPQRLFGLMMFGEIEHKEHVFGAYNQHIGETCARSNGRCYPVMVPSYSGAGGCQGQRRRLRRTRRALSDDPDQARQVRRRPDHPVQPRAAWTPLWAAIEASGLLPLAFHIGARAIPTAEPGRGRASRCLTQMQGFRQNWAQLTFGGVFDRFPGLQVVFVEAGLAWIPGMLHDADMIYNSFPTLVSPKLEHPPSWYWRVHCYATFMTDPVGLEMLHRIGADRVMWSSDYPHQESTFGYTRSAIDAVFKAVPVEDAQKILGLTALALFRMED